MSNEGSDRWSDDDGEEVTSAPAPVPTQSLFKERSGHPGDGLLDEDDGSHADLPGFGVQLRNTGWIEETED